MQSVLAPAVTFRWLSSAIVDRVNSRHQQDRSEKLYVHFRFCAVRKVGKEPAPTEDEKNGVEVCAGVGPRGHTATQTAVPAADCRFSQPPVPRKLRPHKRVLMKPETARSRRRIPRPKSCGAPRSRAQNRETGDAGQRFSLHIGRSSYSKFLVHSASCDWSNARMGKCHFRVPWRESCRMSSLRVGFSRPKAVACCRAVQRPASVAASGVMVRSSPRYVLKVELQQRRGLGGWAGHSCWANKGATCSGDAADGTKSSCAGGDVSASSVGPEATSAPPVSPVHTVEAKAASGSQCGEDPACVPGVRTITRGYGFQHQRLFAASFWALQSCCQFPLSDSGSGEDVFRARAAFGSVSVEDICITKFLAKLWASQATSRSYLPYVACVISVPRDGPQLMAVAWTNQTLGSCDFDGLAGREDGQCVQMCLAPLERTESARLGHSGEPIRPGAEGLAGTDGPCGALRCSGRSGFLSAFPVENHPHAFLREPTS
ncbi:hypothetical protein CB1_000294051 [Camelus ferus]|nr:hypothetical protein CB1_000294051 [Camelus ferus]